MDPQSHPPVSWNMDIMHIVMSYANRRVISNLMKTCNALNSEGARYLLQDGVTLRREERLVSFVWFSKARRNPKECLRRLTSLKKLSLGFYHPTEDVARLLEGFFDILARATFDFTSLEISNAEALLTTHPPLGAAIAKLTTLKTLNLSEVGDHCATLLRTLQSSLVVAEISFNIRDREREDEVIRGDYDTNPILLLEGSQSTLESLSMSFAVSAPDGPCYANVTLLSLSCIDLPFIEDYIRAFPNLVSLTTFECGGYRDDPELWEVRREMSMLDQAQHGTWRSLRHYSGSMLDLWIFGLTCQIQTIAMGFPRHGVDPNRLNDVLLDVRPSQLVLTLPGASCLLDEAVRSVLSREGRLRELDLRVLLHIHGNDETVSVGDILDLLVDVVRASSVPTFKLKLDLTWIGVVRRRAKSDGDEGLPIMPFEIYLRDMDVDAYADALFASVASLKEVQVSVVEPRDGCTRQADRRRTEPNDRNPTNASSGVVGVQTF